MPSAQFTEASKATRYLTQKPSTDELLELYGLYKQATQDPPFDKAPAPGMFDLKGKAKYRSWESKKSLSPKDAEQKYITLVAELKKKYKYDPNKEPEQLGGQ